MKARFTVVFVIVNAFLFAPFAEPTSTVQTHTPTPTKIVGLDYPCLALLNHVEGEVAIDCIVDEKGMCSSLRLVRGHPLLVKKVKDNLGEWRFDHGVTNTKNPVRLTYSFRISSTPVQKGNSASRFIFKYPDHVVLEGQLGTDATCPPPFKTDKVFGPKTDLFIQRR